MTDITEKPESTNDLLDLAQDRVIAFRDRGCSYRYTFPPIADKDWERYFDAIVQTSHREGSLERKRFDVQSALSELVRRVVTNVDGYAGDFLKREDWRDLLPVAHVRFVSTFLQLVLPDTSSVRVLDPLHQEVALRATWTADEKGTMAQFFGLVHRFRPLTAEHELRLNRALSQTSVLGNGRNAKTIYPSRQKELLKFYDELIDGVEGYAFKGEPITTKQLAIEKMDAWHKVAALDQLMTVIDFGEAETEE